MMTMQSRWSTAWLLASLVLPAASRAQEIVLPDRPEPEIESVVSRVYRVHHIDLVEAFALARSQCPSIRSPCGGNISHNEGFFELEAQPSTHEKVTAMLQREDVPPPEVSLRVVLLKADDSEPASVAQLPPQAQEALKDVQGFLPFKSFQILGTGQVMTSGGEVELSIDDNYRVQMSVEPRRRLETSVNIHSLRIFAEPKDKPVLNTSLRMQVNETVVLGTSSSAGGKQALVALLSAIPAP